MKTLRRYGPFLLVVLSSSGLFPQVTEGRISGYLRDASSGEPLMYANVVLIETPYGAASTVQGYYVISDIPPGKYTLRVTMMGYETTDRSLAVESGSEIRLDLDIPVRVIPGDEVLVTAERTRFREKVEISRLNISFKEIKTLPAFIEADLFRSLQLLPGVTAQNDFSAALIVRGGSPDENLILLDGTEVYNPYHIGGVFSTFNADAISDAEFLAGGYPAEYGGRISSVLKITSREGNSKEGCLTQGTKLAKYWDLSHIKGEISALSSKAFMEGPFYRGSWMFSVRRTYFDQLARIYYWLKDDPQNWTYYFWDTQGKVITDINSKHRLTFSSYNGRDRLAFVIGESSIDEIDFNWDWGNNTACLQWRYVPNSKFFSETWLSLTQYSFDLDLTITSVDSVYGQASNRILVSNLVRDYSLKEKLTFYLNSKNTISCGMDVKFMGLSFRQRLDDVDYFDIGQNPSILSIYAQNRWRPNALFSMLLGGRLSKYELHPNWYLEPRIGLKYNLTENWVLKGAWGIYRQFIFTTNDENEVLRVVDFWEPVPADLKAEQNQHFIIGAERWFGEGFTGLLEGYYKPYGYILANNPDNNPADDTDDFIAGKREAWGIELLLKRNSGRLTGWMGYAYSVVENRIDFNGDGTIHRNDDEIYCPNYHRPHNFNLYLSWELNAKNRISLVWTTSSGQPYTPIVGKVYTQSEFGDLENPYRNLVNLEGRINSGRYPYYLRCDLGWVRSIQPFGIPGKLKFQIINVTNHFNVLLYDWDHSKSPSRVTAVGMFPVIPTLGLELNFE